MSNDAAIKAIVEMEKKLRNISGVIKKSGRKILKNYPITSTQFIALQWLLEEGNLTIGELSNKIDLAFSTTTDLIDRMEKNELVERVRGTTDRRIVRIHILEKGKMIIHEVIEMRQEYLGKVLEEFTMDQTDTLNELLDLLHKQMKNVNENTH